MKRSNYLMVIMIINKHLFKASSDEIKATFLYDIKGIKTFPHVLTALELVLDVISHYT